MRVSLQIHSLRKVEIPPQPFAALKPAARAVVALPPAHRVDGNRVEIPPQPFAALKPLEVARLRGPRWIGVLGRNPPQPFAALKPARLG